MYKIGLGVVFKCGKPSQSIVIVARESLQTFSRVTRLTVSKESEAHRPCDVPIAGRHDARGAVAADARLETLRPCLT